MPSYTGIKLLSSAFFDSSLKDSQMFVHCLNTQASWLISPMQSETANNKSFFIWNPQNSLINSKALQTLNPENENKIEFNKEEMASAKIVHLKKMSPLAKFEALLLKYRYLEKYDKILNDDNLPFQNKLNEIVFINESPYDYVTFTLFDGITKEKKGICQVCLMDLEENKLNLEFLLDPKLNIIVGTISFLVEFRSCQSNNAKNLDFYKTINTTQMLNYDDFNKLNYTRILSNNYGYYYEMERNMREFRGNYFTNSTKIVKFHIEIDEIWNCFELIDIPEIVYQDRNLAIICKIGIYSYSIPINILTFTFDKIKNNHPEIYKALINESQMQYVEKKNIKNSETAILNIYFLSKKPNEIMMISLEKNSNFWVIIENPCIMISLQLVQKKEIIKFYKAFMKDLLIFKEKGVLILGMEVNNLKKKKNLGFNSSMIFAKFLYEIKEDLDYSKENFSEGLYQIYLVNDERNINKNQLQELVQMNYGKILGFFLL